MHSAYLPAMIVIGSAALAACGSDVSSTTTGSGGAGSTSASTSASNTASGTGSTSSATTGSGSTTGTAAQTSSGTASVSSSSGTGGGWMGCPPALPPDGGPCTGYQIGLTCEYGDDPRPYCRDFAICDTFEGVDPSWALKVADCPPIAPPADCPAEPDATGASCSIEGGLCVYGDGAQCGCSSCGAGPCGMEPLWWCSPAPQAGCPASAPNTGQPCSPQGQVCDYGTCASSTIVQRVCMGDAWIDDPVACPL